MGDVLFTWMRSAEDHRPLMVDGCGARLYDDEGSHHTQQNHNIEGSATAATQENRHIA